MDKLFESKSRARLLKLFFHNPHTAFTVTEIADKTSLTPTEIKKTLTRLAQMEIIRVAKKGYAKNKKANKK